MALRKTMAGRQVEWVEAAFDEEEMSYLVRIVQ